MSDKIKHALIATKSEMRDLHQNPSALHFVLICKGTANATNDHSTIPPPLLSLLKEFQDVFPDDLPHGLLPLRGIEHRIDLFPGAPLPNRAAYHTNLEETNEIERQIHDFLQKGLFEKASHLVLFRLFLFLRVMTLFECVWIVASSMPLAFYIVILFLV
jgi:hypothetical protein